MWPEGLGWLTPHPLLIPQGSWRQMTSSLPLRWSDSTAGFCEWGLGHQMGQEPEPLCGSLS